MSHNAWTKLLFSGILALSVLVIVVIYPWTPGTPGKQLADMAKSYLSPSENISTQDSPPTVIEKECTSAESDRVQIFQIKWKETGKNLMFWNGFKEVEKPTFNPEKQYMSICWDSQNQALDSLVLKVKNQIFKFIGANPVDEKNETKGYWLFENLDWQRTQPTAVNVASLSNSSVIAQSIAPSATATQTAEPTAEKVEIQLPTPTYILEATWTPISPRVVITPLPMLPTETPIKIVPLSVSWVDLTRNQNLGPLIWEQVGYHLDCSYLTNSGYCLSDTGLVVNVWSAPDPTNVERLGIAWDGQMTLGNDPELGGSQFYAVTLWPSRTAIQPTQPPQCTTISFWDITVFQKVKIGVLTHQGNDQWRSDDGSCFYIHDIRGSIYDSHGKTWIWNFQQVGATMSENPTGKQYEMESMYDHPIYVSPVGN